MAWKSAFWFPALLAWRRGVPRALQVLQGGQCLSRAQGEMVTFAEQNSEAISLGSQLVLEGPYVSLIVSAPSSSRMNQMLGCASRGWEHGQKQVLGEQRPGPVGVQSGDKNGVGD